MPLTLTNVTGDGVGFTSITTNIQLPDSGSSVLIGGTIDPAGANPAVAITGSPLTAPAAPGSGSVFWIIQVDTTSGAATIKQSTSGIPSPDAGNVIVFTQTLVVGNTNLAAVPTNITPDTY